MKEKAAATVLLIYALVLAVGVTIQTVIDRSFNLMTIPIHGIIIVGPAVGVFRRKRWCRIALGCLAGFVFAIFLLAPIRYGEFHFKWAYLGYLAATGVPVYLLFFWKPLVRYTEKKEPNQPAQRNASTGSVSNLESPARRG
jgi:hypothetical protein